MKVLYPKKFIRHHLDLVNSTCRISAQVTMAGALSHGAPFGAGRPGLSDFGFGFGV